MRAIARYLIPWSAFALVLVVSCSKDNPTSPLPLPPPPLAAGSWIGTLTQGTTTGDMMLKLSQNVLQVRGTGTLGAISLTVSGENHYPAISFTCSSPGYQPFSFSGSFTSPTQLDGRVNGSGFSNAIVSLSKN